MKQLASLRLVVVLLGAAGCVTMVPRSAAADGCCARKEAATSATCDHATGQGCSGHNAPTQFQTGTRQVSKQVEPVFASYERLRADLAADQTNVTSAATALATAMRSSGSGCLAQSAELAQKIGSAPDLKSARAEFAKLSDLMLQYVNIAQIGGYHGFYCGMAKAGWLQTSERIANPYMGKAMLECGKMVF